MSKGQILCLGDSWATEFGLISTVPQELRKRGFDPIPLPVTAKGILTTNLVAEIALKTIATAVKGYATASGSTTKALFLSAGGNDIRLKVDHDPLTNQPIVDPATGFKMERRILDLMIRPKVPGMSPLAAIDQTRLDQFLTSIEVNYKTILDVIVLAAAGKFTIITHGYAHPYTDDAHWLGLYQSICKPPKNWSETDGAIIMRKLIDDLNLSISKVTATFHGAVVHLNFCTTIDRLVTDSAGEYKKAWLDELHLTRNLGYPKVVDQMISQVPALQ